MIDPENSACPFSIDLSSATRAHDDTIVIALHSGARVLLLKASLDVATGLARKILAEAEVPEQDSDSGEAGDEALPVPAGPDDRIAQEILWRAERRYGELIKDQKDSVGLALGGAPAAADHPSVDEQLAALLLEPMPATAQRRGAIQRLLESRNGSRSRGSLPP
jgi:hypothetical protein